MMVPKATTTKTKDTPVVAALENSNTEGVGTIVSSGVNIA